jgi:hypothetical protein
MKATRQCEGVIRAAVAYSLTLTVDVAFGQRCSPAVLPPSKKPLYPSYRWLGGLLNRFRRVRKILHPTGLEPRILEPAASSYTNCTIPVAIFSEY